MTTLETHRHLHQMTWEEVKTKLSSVASVVGDSPLYGIPRGGAICAGLLYQWGLRIVDRPEAARFIIDDIVANGDTRQRYQEKYPQAQFLSLIEKADPGDWYVFPWEHDRQTDMDDIIHRIITSIGDDPSREGLRETPRRVIQSWQEIFSGYTEDVDSILKWFDSTADEMVILRNIHFWSTCEHHMQPFWGHADIAYIPRGKVIGISKLARLTNAIARRLQIQENLTAQIGQALLRDGNIWDVGVSITSKHTCMIARGVRQENSEMTTNFLYGAFKDDPATRAEFLRR